MRNKFQAGSQVNEGGKHSEETRHKMSVSHYGKKLPPFLDSHRKHLSESTKGKIAWNKGGHWSDDTKLRISESRKGITAWNKGRHSHWLKGRKNPNWKGGISRHNRTERNYLMQTLEYKIWRRGVFERDNYTCVWCGDKDFKGRGGSIVLQADHIKPFQEYPELRFALDNGRTLCLSCHKKTGTWGRRKSPKLSR